MPAPYPPPSLQSFDRFQAADGLLIRAEHWRRAHAYHRQRQNLYFQSLHQPGIVSGLAVRPIEAPANIAAHYQDGRWVQIEPGLAIDVEGNPIVVTQAEPYRIAIKLPPGGTLTVYLVISYVDPDNLHQRTPKEFVRETFRLDERTSPPKANEVELCRVQLADPLTTLSLPEDPFSPQVNQIDVAHRQPVGLRPQGTVRVAQALTGDRASDRNRESLMFLMEATQALYPPLVGLPAIASVDLATEAIDNLDLYDLIYLTGQQTLSLSPDQLHRLHTYVTGGGVLLVDPQVDGVALAKSVVALAKEWGLPLERFEHLGAEHPLRRRPFLFAVPPSLHQQPLQVLAGAGLVLTSGLARGWGLEAKPPLAREVLRSVQEFGINILHYAWRRRTLAQLLGYQSNQPLPRQPVAPSRALPDLLPQPISTEDGRKSKALDQLIDSGNRSVLDQFIE